MIEINKYKLSSLVTPWGEISGDINDQKDLISLIVEKTGSSMAEVREWVNAQGFLTEHQDISGLATKEEVAAVEGKIPSLTGYATEEWVEGKGYLTEHQDISGLATKNELSEVEGKIPSLTGYATESWVEGKGYLTEHQDISGLATKEEVAAVEGKIPSLTGYATESWVEGKGYLTEHQSIKTVNGESIIGEGNVDIVGVTPEQEALINQVPGKVNQVRLVTDGSAIRHDGALEPLTFEQIYALVMDNSKYVYIVMDNNIRFRPSAYDGDAIWFDSSFIEEGKPNILRCIINSENRVDITQIVVASEDWVEGKIPSLEGYATKEYVDQKIGTLETITNEILG